MSKKKKFIKLNQTIRHYFGEDGFDEGIQRVSEETLIELAQVLGLVTENNSKKNLVRIFRTLWSEADIDLRRHIVDFFKAEDKVYVSSKPKADNVNHDERAEKIEEILLDMPDVTKEEALELHHAFLDVRTKKINLYKLQSKLEHLRFEKKRATIEKSIQGIFDVENRLEFNASLLYEIEGESFHKIQPLRTKIFSFSFLQESPIDEIVAALTEAKTELTTHKQKELTLFLKSIPSPHAYLSKEEIIAAIKRAEPNADVTTVALTDAILKRIFEPLVSLSGLSQTMTEMILSIQAEFIPQHAKQSLPYELHILLPKRETLQRIWNAEELAVYTQVQKEQLEHEEHFHREFSELLEGAKEAAASLQMRDEEVTEKVLEVLLPQLHAVLLI